MLRHDGYKTVVSYQFCVGEEYPYAVVEWGAPSEDPWVAVEETRKNGQEDTHCYGVLLKVGGQWEWEDGSRDCFDEYQCASTADKIRAYLNEHGAPGESRA